MRTALWETSTGALAALLNSGAPVRRADLYTLTLAGGAVYRWSGHDLQLSGGGNTWTLGPGLKRTRVRFTVGVEVDTLTVTLTDNVGTTINGTPLIPFIANDGLRGARLQLDRAFWGVADTAPVGALLWFPGRVSIWSVDRYQAQLTIKSDLELLDVMVPREVYQPPCLNTVYDAACGASKAAFTVTGTASAPAAAGSAVFSHGLAQAAGYFDLGGVTFTSGANAGITRTVRTHAGGTITVTPPWPGAIAAGDAFAIYPGCDLTQGGANGCPKFHTAAEVKVRFRGQPYIPLPDTVT